jgi:hypothetical protein
MATTSFEVDPATLDSSDWALDEFLTAYSDGQDPMTTKEIVQWLMLSPSEQTTTREHLEMMALICATAMQRLLWMERTTV